MDWLSAGAAIITIVVGIITIARFLFRRRKQKDPQVQTQISKSSETTILGDIKITTDITDSPGAIIVGRDLKVSHLSVYTEEAHQHTLEKDKAQVYSSVLLDPIIQQAHTDEVSSPLSMYQSL